jgi:hypothetical protein
LSLALVFVFIIQFKMVVYDNKNDKLVGLIIFKDFISFLFKLNPTSGKRGRIQRFFDIETITTIIIIIFITAAPWR